MHYYDYNVMLEVFYQHCDITIFNKFYMNEELRTLYKEIIPYSLKRSRDENNIKLFDYYHSLCSA